jgi:signal transduction histidine kinase
VRGQGFVNMADRLGAIGGSVAVWSAPGEGTRITGRVPGAATLQGDGTVRP